MKTHIEIKVETLIEKFADVGYYAEVVLASKKALESYPMNAKLWYLLGVGLGNTQYPRLAVDAFTTSLNLSFDESVFCNLILALIDSGNVPQAMQLLDSCIEEFSQTMQDGIFLTLQLAKRNGRLDWETVPESLKSLFEFYSFLFDSK